MKNIIVAILAFTTGFLLCSHVIIFKHAKDFTINYGNVADWVVAIGTAILALFSYKAAQYTKKIWKNEQFKIILDKFYKEQDDLVDILNEQSRSLSNLYLGYEKIDHNINNIYKLFFYGNRNPRFISFERTLMRLRKTLRNKENKNIIDDLMASICIVREKRKPILLGLKVHEFSIKDIKIFSKNLTSQHSLSLEMINDYIDSIKNLKKNLKRFNSDLKDESESL